MAFSRNIAYFGVQLYTSFQILLAYFPLLVWRILEYLSRGRISYLRKMFGIKFFQIPNTSVAERSTKVAILKYKTAIMMIVACFVNLSATEEGIK